MIELDDIADLQVAADLLPVVGIVLLLLATAAGSRGRLHRYQDTTGAGTRQL